MDAHILAAVGLGGGLRRRPVRRHMAVASEPLDRAPAELCARREEQVDALPRLVGPQLDALAHAGCGSRDCRRSCHHSRIVTAMMPTTIDESATLNAQKRGPPGMPTSTKSTT